MDSKARVLAVEPFGLSSWEHLDARLVELLGAHEMRLCQYLQTSLDSHFSLHKDALNRMNCKLELLVTPPERHAFPQLPQQVEKCDREETGENRADQPMSLQRCKSDKVASKVGEVLHRANSEKATLSVAGQARHRIHEITWLWHRPALLHAMVQNPLIKAASFLCIVINSSLITFQADQALRYGARRQLHESLDAVQNVFTGIFLLELLLRLAAERGHFFIASEAAWNLFDTVVILFGFMDEFGLTALRVVRIFRAFRLLEAAAFMRELRLMIFMLFSSFKSLHWVAILVALTIYIFATFFASSVAAAMIIHDTEAVSDLDIEDLERLYRDVPTIMFTLLRAALGGEDWGDCVNPLFQVGPLSVFMFLAFEGFMLFAFLNIVTGVFVENTKATFLKDDEQAAREFQEAEEERICSLGDLFTRVHHEHGYGSSPTSESGADSEALTKALNEQQFHEILNHEDVRAYFGAIGIDVSRVHKLFKLLDSDGSGFVSIDEFVVGCMRVCGQAKALDILEIMKENKRIIMLLKGLRNEAHEQYIGLLDSMKHEQPQIMQMPREKSQSLKYAL